MKIINFAEQNSIINKYMAEMRDKDYQTNRLLFRNNIMRVGELIAYELSKTFDYEERDVQTPLGTARVNMPTDNLVLGTIFRAGLPFHQGFLNIFDHAGNAFVSAFREYEDEAHTKVGIHVEYLATPDLNNATLLIVDPMLATGGSMEMGYPCLNEHMYIVPGFGVEGDLCYGGKIYHLPKAPPKSPTPSPPVGGSPLPLWRGVECLEYLRDSSV